MKIEDIGIYLHARPLGDTNLIATFFTKENGLYSGIIRHGASSKNRAKYQIGNIFELSWTARLQEHLGTFTPKLYKSQSIDLISNTLSLNITNTISFAIKNLLAEREEHSIIYENTIIFMNYLSTNRDQLSQIEAIQKYIEWELSLMSEIGFGLDLSKCNATGTKKNLKYISPKTGKAISESAGKEYADKLFLIPIFLIENKEPNINELKDLFHINNYFLRKNALKYTDDHKTQQLLTIREKIIK